MLKDLSPLVESAGLDEAYVDLSGIGEATEGPRRAAEDIRTRVRAETGLAVSIGVAGGKTTAKVASDRAKPDGLLDVPTGGDAAFLAPLPIRELPMVGPTLEEALRAAGVRTIGQAAGLDPAYLRRRFGSSGELLAERARGVDFLAAPYGLLDRRVLDTAREVGYQAVCGSLSWPARPGAAIVNRVAVYRNTTTARYRR